MQKRKLICKSPNIGNLDEFLELIYTLRKEFNLHTIAIGATNNDERDMFVNFDMNGANVSIDYKYYYGEIYLDFICNDDKVDTMKSIEQRIKELVS